MGEEDTSCECGKDIITFLNTTDELRKLLNKYTDFENVVQYFDNIREIIIELKDNCSGVEIEHINVNIDIIEEFYINKLFIDAKEKLKETVELFKDKIMECGLKRL